MKLLRKLNVKVIELNCIPNGIFSHNPEPIQENLNEICNAVKHFKADLGIAVDPDVDRLAFIDEMGKYFGEEYTLVACADYVLNNNSGPTVSNLSSTKALKELTESKGCNYFYSAVGEVNVVETMKSKNAVIDGRITPPLPSPPITAFLLFIVNVNHRIANIFRPICVVHIFCDRFQVFTPNTCV